VLKMLVKLLTVLSLAGFVMSASAAERLVRLSTSLCEEIDIMKRHQKLTRDYRTIHSISGTCHERR
jgi:hypothetical protein